jgi:hypothetical protein
MKLSLKNLLKDVLLIKEADVQQLPKLPTSDGEEQSQTEKKPEPSSDKQTPQNNVPPDASKVATQVSYTPINLAEPGTAYAFTSALDLAKQTNSIDGFAYGLAQKLQIRDKASL